MILNSQAIDSRPQVPLVINFQIVKLATGIFLLLADLWAVVAMYVLCMIQGQIFLFPITLFPGSLMKILVIFSHLIGCPYYFFMSLFLKK